MLVNAPIFGRLLTLLGIRENVALTKVDLSRAIPTIHTNGAILAEVGEYRTFQHLSVQVAAAEVTLDPRSATNWDEIQTRGEITTDPVPADHDYIIYSAGVDLSVNREVLLFREFTTGLGVSAEALFFYSSVIAAQGAGYHNDGVVLVNFPSSSFSPVGDPTIVRVGVGGAVTLGVTMRVLSAPPGLLFPHA